jgi:mono/diheme cytochrome c family protein
MLDHDGEGVTLGKLIAEGKLTSPPVGSGSPYFPLPGDATAQAALGYMHSNCGSCHNPTSEVPGTGEALQNLRLEVMKMATVEGTPAFTTTVCQEEQTNPPIAGQVITPGQPEASAVFVRMNQRGNEDQMPKLATELVDDTGLAAVRAWIESLDACP